MGRKRHKYRDGVPTAEFPDLNRKERAQSINAQKINLGRCERAHQRMVEAEKAARHGGWE
jgi:hypothetical protein